MAKLEHLLAGPLPLQGRLCRNMQMSWQPTQAGLAFDNKKVGAHGVS